MKDMITYLLFSHTGILAGPDRTVKHAQVTFTLQTAPRHHRNLCIIHIYDNDMNIKLCMSAALFATGVFSLQMSILANIFTAFSIYISWVFFYKSGQKK